MKLCKICSKPLVKISGGKNWEKKIYCNKICKYKVSSKVYAKKHKLQISEYHKKWYLKNRDKILERQKRYKKENREKIRPYLKIKMREYRNSKEFRRKDNIRRLTNHYFKRSKNCKFCKTKENLEFHHFKYKLPLNKKDFITVCKKCHRKIENGFIK